jgi:uncharacterized protein involved in response to NO
MARAPAFAVLFPAAAVWAAAMVALKAAAAVGWWQPPGHWPADWHGHELVFGFAFAVVGGYLLTRPGWPGAVAAPLAWAAGRVAHLAPGLASWAEAALALAYPALLVVLAGLPLARAAKRPRNRVFAPLIAALAAAEAVYQLGTAGGLPGGGRPGLLLGTGLLFLLLFVMGGRFAASVAAGLHHARGRALVRLSQPRLERIGVALLAPMALLDAAAAAGALPAALPGTLALAAATVMAVRLAGWRGWLLLDDRGLGALQAGYALLALGLALKGGSQLAAPALLSEAMHLALVGGLGTLTLTVMVRVARQRRRLGDPLPPVGVVAAGLVALAAGLRLAAGGGYDRALWLALAAGFWCAAWGLFAAALVSRARATRGR